jgi:hypothetical protein
MKVFKLTVLVLLGALFLFPLSVLSQKSKSKIDYSIRSNFLDPDTLKLGTNEYKIFWHFIKWTYKEVDEIKVLVLKGELETIGIYTKDDDFDIAYSFFKNEVVYHKRSVENWGHFKELVPK